MYSRGGENEELRYAIRSWCKNFKFDRLAVAHDGELPHWLMPDIDIPVESGFDKNFQAVKNIKAGLADDELSKDVIIMMDDIFILSPSSWPKNFNFNRGTLRAQWESRDYTKFSAYSVQVQTTDTYLRRLKVPNPLSFEEHAPFFANRRALLDIFDEHEEIPQVLWRSVYGNLMKVKTQYKYDLKLLDNESSYRDDEIMVSTSDDTFKYSPGGEKLRKTFSVASRYELC